MNQVVIENHKLYECLVKVSRENSQQSEVIASLKAEVLSLKQELELGQSFSPINKDSEKSVNISAAAAQSKVMIDWQEPVKAVAFLASENLEDLKQPEESKGPEMAVALQQKKQKPRNKRKKVKTDDKENNGGDDENRYLDAVA